MGEASVCRNGATKLTALVIPLAGNNAVLVMRLFSNSVWNDKLRKQGGVYSISEQTDGRGGT